MKTAYIQSVGGASGDMLLGALLDAGLPLDAVREAVDAMAISGVSVETATETRCEVRGTRALIDVSAASRYSPAQMLDTVAGAAGLSERTREQASVVLKALFAAEARVHGNDPDQIHLHELGTADTLVDVVGVVHGLEQLGVERVYAAPLVLGEPTGPRRPGGYSNPAPATLEIIAAAGAPVAPERQFHAGAGELTTPTGAALITTLADEFRQPAMTIDRIGVGVGGKDPAAFPNVLRLWLGEPVPTIAKRSTAIPGRSEGPALRPLAGQRGAAGNQPGQRHRRATGFRHGASLRGWRSGRVAHADPDEEEPPRRPAVGAGSGIIWRAGWPRCSCATRRRWGCASARWVATWPTGTP